MTIEEKLDLILNECKDHYGHLPEEKNWQRICRLVTDGDGSTTGNPDYKFDPVMLMLLRGLEKDGFIEWFNNTKANPAQEYWVASYKGMTFEGFAKRKENELISFKEVSGKNRRMERNEQRLVYWTKMLGLGTFALALIELIVHRKEILSLFDCH